MRDYIIFNKLQTLNQSMTKIHEMKVMDTFKHEYVPSIEPEGHLISGSRVILTFLGLNLHSMYVKAMFRTDSGQPFSE